MAQSRLYLEAYVPFYGWYKRVSRHFKKLKYQMNKFISYEGLPINSGGAHSLGKKTALENYAQTVQFLNRFANTNKPTNIEVILYQSEKKEYNTLKLITKLILKFGIPKFNNDGLLSSLSWKLSENEIEKGFETLKLNTELPENSKGPLVLSFLWNFSFIDPKTNQILPNQEKIPELDFRIKNSRIYLRTSNKSSISVWFALPFEELGKYEIEYINELKSCLPFKPSEKHWRIWKKSEKGNWVPNKTEIKNVG